MRGAGASSSQRGIAQDCRTRIWYSIFYVVLTRLQLGADMHVSMWVLKGQAPCATNYTNHTISCSGAPISLRLLGQTCHGTWLAVLAALAAGHHPHQLARSPTNQVSRQAINVTNNDYNDNTTPSKSMITCCSAAGEEGGTQLLQLP